MPHLDIWNRYMRCYDFLNCVDSYSQNIRDIAKALEPRPGMKVLDAGSGTGNLSILLKLAGANVVSCDFSQSALQLHRAKDPYAELVKTSLEEPLPFGAQSFDAVCCASVLFALTQTGCCVAVNEFRRILKPTGRLIVTVGAPAARNGNLIALHLRGLSERHGRVRGWMKGVADLPALIQILYYNRLLARLPDWHGFHRFTEAELRGLVAGAGFQQIDIRMTYGGCFFLLTAHAPAAAIPQSQFQETSVAAVA